MLAKSTDGWVTIEMIVNPQGELSMNSNMLNSYLRVTFGNVLGIDYPGAVSLPVVKGKTFVLWYSKLVKLNMFKFIYAIGAEPTE